MSVRDYVLETLSGVYGQPRASSKGAEWWITFPQNPHSRGPVHIFLNDATPAGQNNAHIVVFDPRGFEGTNVIEERVSSTGQADELFQRIARIVDSTPGWSSHDGPPPESAGLEPWQALRPANADAVAAAGG